jgi:hypothetical protein
MPITRHPQHEEILKWIEENKNHQGVVVVGTHLTIPDMNRTLTAYKAQLEQDKSQRLYNLSVHHLRIIKKTLQK